MSSRLANAGLPRYIIDMARRQTSVRRQSAKDRKPIGRRAGVVLAIERPAIDRLSLVDVPIVKPSAADVERLTQLYELGSRYHQAHATLSTRRNQAFDAVHSVAAAVDRSAWRVAVRDVLHAAEELERSADELASLIGVEQLGFVVRAAVQALDTVPTATSESHLDEALAALSHLQVQRRAVLTGVPRPALADRLLAYEMDASVPVGDGATGYEWIQQLRFPPWTEVAWFAWCAAGRGVKWPVAWVTWPPIDRYAFEIMGRAAGMTAAAVRESRRRQQLR